MGCVQGKPAQGNAADNGNKNRSAKDNHSEGKRENDKLIANQLDDLMNKAVRQSI